MEGISKPQKARVEHLLPVISDDGARQRVENRFLYISHDSPFFSSTQKTPDVTMLSSSHKAASHANLVKLPDIDGHATLGATQRLLQGSQSVAQLSKKVEERFKKELPSKAMQKRMKAAVWVRRGGAGAEKSRH